MKCSDCENQAATRKRSTGRCSPCHKIYSRALPRNKARVTANALRWRLANPERFREKSLAWQKANPERAKEIRVKTCTGDRNRWTRSVYLAKRRGLDFTITQQELSDLRKDPCFYCEASLDKYGSGLDRIDNSMGYNLGNVVPCCGRCNRIRGDRLTHIEMLTAMSAIADSKSTHYLLYA